MGIWLQISNTFWSSSFWLPKNTTWADVEPGSRPNINYADYRDLVWSLPIAVLLLTIRCCSEKYIFSSIGQLLGIKSTRSSRKQPMPNRILERTYIKSNRLDERMLMELTEQMDTMTQREIERWWRLRQAQGKPTALRKFCESSWRCLYYSYSFSFGLFVLWDKPWLWDIEHCELNYPHHSLDNGLWLYMIVSLSMYLTQSVSQFVDVKRKDFWMVFAHHIATVTAISLSWISHFHRMGSLVLLYHDIAEIFLEATKMAIYAKYQKLSDIIMVIFVLIWTVSRMVFYPQLVYYCLDRSLRSGRATFVPCILVGLIVLLQCMHIVWTYMIFKLLCNALKAGGVKNDCRSSSESNDSCSELSATGNSRKSGKLHQH